MALSQRLDLRQSQSLVMTPQLQQAIKLLQLSNMELSDFVEQELERNPLLERDDGESGDRAGAEEASAEPASRETAEAPMVDALPGQQEEAPLDVDYDNTWNNDSLADGAGDFGAWNG